MRNTGQMPPMLRGRRIRVELRNGIRPAESWPADGIGGCHWALENHPFDIVKFEVA